MLEPTYLPTLIIVAWNRNHTYIHLGLHCNIEIDGNKNS